MRRSLIIVKYILLTLLCIPLSPVVSKAYSVVTHEAIIDALWEKSFQPLLLQKYPGLTEAQLKEAHSYAYGGAITPDMGYFPFGSHVFTNLVHYVRSGDFVNSLLDEVKDANEYAFALGFLCHYMSDKYGHNIGTNQCVPIVYPKLKEKFGAAVTYDEDNLSHKRIEFAFDVLQTAKGNYASQAYHDFIGFHVSRELLERAFLKTYGITINSVFRNLSLSIETFRFSVMSLFPVLTRTAWVIRKNEILKTQPTATNISFRYTMSRANYYQQFGDKSRKPGFMPFVLSWFVRVLPKIGPLASLKIKDPGPDAEKLFIQSFDTVLANCHTAMKKISRGKTVFTNIDFDTGNETVQGEYKPADMNYGKLLVILSKHKFENTNTALKENMLRFYGNHITKLTKEKGLKHRDIKKIHASLEALKNKDPISLKQNPVATELSIK